MDRNRRGLLGLLGGVLLGVPASYYLQSGMLRAKVSLAAYLTHLPELLNRYGSDVFPPLLLTCAVLGAIGWFLGRRAGGAV